MILIGIALHKGTLTWNTGSVGGDPPGLPSKTTLDDPVKMEFDYTNKYVISLEKENKRLETENEDLKTQVKSL